MNNDTATKIDAIAILVRHQVEGATVLEVDCRDYGHFSSMPQVVRTEDGIVCVRTGWNSDTGRACFKSHPPFGFLAYDRIVSRHVPVSVQS